MKKLLFLLALGAAPPVLHPVFAQTQSAPVPVIQGAPFQWRLNLKAGQKFLTTTGTTSDTGMEMSTMPGAPKTGAPLWMETRSQTRMVIEQNVLSSDAKGARVEMIYRDITQSSVIRQGDKVIYDSAQAPDSAKNTDEMFKAMVGARLSYLLSPDGQISDVEGIEEFLKHLDEGAEAMGQTPEAATARKTARATMSTFISPDMVKQMFGETYRAMPKVPVELGGTWKHTSAMPMMGTTFTQSGQSTFVSRTGNVVAIKQKGALFIDGGAQLEIPNVAARDEKTPAPITQLDLSGTSSGEITLDELTGMTLGSRTTQSMEGDMVMSGLSGKGSVLTIPMRMKTETTSQTKEVTTP